nr:DUF4123 domain-containing protein [Aeromonas hydrophila]
MQSAPLYALLAAASDAEPLQHYYQLDGRDTPRGLYLGTPYHDWLSVMPYLVMLDKDSPFIDWAETTDAHDWGWLVASDQSIDSLYAHLQGLTQIWHQGEAVFFRYWDGVYLRRILVQLGEDFTALLPGVNGIWVGGDGFEWAASEAAAPRAFPWWELPPAIAATLARQDPAPLINNLMQQLADHNGQLYWAFPEANLRCKVARFVSRHPSPDIDLFPALEAALINEVQA